MIDYTSGSMRVGRFTTLCRSTASVHSVVPLKDFEAIAVALNIAAKKIEGEK